ncbi:Hypothetical Protein FCC1311_020032 [Hondaea fermentalgiana]|uniref:Uncharacterized protein n=1 Tax=Hondaea fermentalgiana TaxID=2315210 RepID=A0A2R5GDA3_9STRA|nr:Hypothetical Protein FCC1311_020032 [Hondaea fermentalgiana]|eukprot:GBG25784.1 Hypothetical Protein FCC1311_020032 [Hondaea fermentalgiana]
MITCCDELDGAVAFYNGPFDRAFQREISDFDGFAYALGRVADRHAALSPYLGVIVFSFGPFNAERLPEELRLKLALQSAHYLALFKALVIRHMKANSTFAHAVLDSILCATSRENAWHLPNVLDFFREILMHSIFTTAELKSFEDKSMSMLTRAIQRPAGFEYGEFTTVYDLTPWSINDQFVNVLKDIDAVAGLLLMFAAETETRLSETVLGDLRRVSDKSIAAKTLVAFETQDHESSVRQDEHF